jgi:uncharacterized protein (DUF58 family)
MLPDHVMRELRYIEVYTAKGIRNLKVGPYTSRLRGPGFDFDQHRAYRPGDDVRRIDWNVTARLNAPFVRETHAERELNAVVAVDLSASMRFGTASRSKKEATLFITACLVFSALADQINIGLLAFTDRVVSFRQPRRARARAWTALEELWSMDPPKGRTALLPAARFLSDQLKKSSMIFFISDFMSDEDLSGAVDLKMLAARHDVIGVVVEDPGEMELPQGTNTIRVRDLESGALRRVGLGRSLRQQYENLVRRRRTNLVDEFYRVPMDYVFVRSDGSVIEPLLDLFASRRRP